MFKQKLNPDPLPGFKPKLRSTLDSDLSLKRKFEREKIKTPIE